MRLPPIPTTSAMAAAILALAGCAATITQDGLEQRTAQSLGRDAGSFTISDRQEEGAGRINYRVRTRDGAAYSCYLYGATGFQRAMSFGQTPHSDAICTPLARTGAAPAASPPAPATTCDALRKAANRC